MEGFIIARCAKKQAKPCARISGSVFMCYRLILCVLIAFTAAGCSPWRTFRSSDAHFAADFPAEPESTGLRLNTALGYVDALRVGATDGDVHFAVTEARLPADLLRRASVKAVLQGQQQLEVSTSKAKIIDVQWDADVQGLRFVYLQESGAATGGYYLVRNGRLYLLTVEGPLADARGGRTKRFFDSLTVTP